MFECTNQECGWRGDSGYCRGASCPECMAPVKVALPDTVKVGQ